MSKLLFLLFFTIFLLPLYGQKTNQHGIVLELNSGKRVLPGVLIDFHGAVPTTSDNSGAFTLSFIEKEMGDAVIVREIYKKNYEIVNLNELQLSKIGEKTLEILMSRVGVIDSMKVYYYNISLESMLLAYEERITRLSKNLDAKYISIQQYIEELKGLEQKKQNSQKYALELANKFARTNFDDTSDLYKRAFYQFENGNLDSAIYILEEENLVERAKKRIEERKLIEDEQVRLASSILKNKNEQKEDVNTALLKAEILHSQGCYLKADSLLHLAYMLDRNNLNTLELYAQNKCALKNYECAIELYCKLLNSNDVMKSFYKQIVDSLLILKFKK